MSTFRDMTKTMHRAEDRAASLETALRDLFTHCVMIHRHWGEGSNQKEADAAIATARALVPE